MKNRKSRGGAAPGSRSARGVESVWDYPRPPRVEDTDAHLQVVFNGVTIADTRRAKRVLETSHPPAYYIPPDDVKSEHLIPTARFSVCEWKGRAAYYTVRVAERQAENAAWYYPDPDPRYADIAGYVCFYAGMMDRCTVDGEVVQAQKGSFYGGWITSNIRGPFKGGPGTSFW